MNPVVLMWLSLGGLLIAALSAVGTKALHDFSRHELEIYCRVRKQQQRFGEILDDHHRVALAVENLQVLGSALAALTGGAWLIGSEPQQTEPRFLLTGVCLITGAVCLLAVNAWLPWAISKLWSAPILFYTWRMWRLISRLIMPLSLGYKLFNALAHRLAGRRHQRLAEEEFEDEIRAIVTEGMRDGVVEEDVREMIEGVIELGDFDVADIMTPRLDVDAMDVTIDWQEMLDFVIQVRRTRIPVYEKKLDNVIGILYVKDLLPELAKQPHQACRSLREILRKPWFLPKTKPVDDLLQEFQRSGNHIAIVVDEYMAMSGVVTIEDVLEEIVGEIVDEYDKEVMDEIVEVDEQTVEMPGRVHIDEVNERLGLKLPDEEEFDTIGGFVSVKLGHLPHAGEQLQWNSVRITVVEASRLRVERVRVQVLTESQPELA